MICPPDHKHAATLTCHSRHGCRCTDCIAGHRDHAYWRRHMNAAGRTHLINSLVPATGTRRRIEALMTLGWSQSALATHLGSPQTRISEWLRTNHVTRRVHERVAAAYEPLSVRTPPTDTPAQRMSVNRTRALAARRGWVGPFAWDDIDNDPAPQLHHLADTDIDEVAVFLAVEGQQPVTLTREERLEAVRQLHARGYNDTPIAHMLRCAVKTITRDREHLGLPGNPAPQERTAA